MNWQCEDQENRDDRIVAIRSRHSRGWALFPGNVGCRDKCRGERRQ